ncbi:hypothetical protein DSM3645_17560 [Blastopirellula marina DSM 3645]|uniref:Uncharacterized protein n=1 Tax=Blastopirellula marina DSM 3645 TaxID=314230 RepID=A3ZNT4_9BACT|nr:hypothetical protein DSM3645_17560 [Blastopirellula marina DSM 3645]
MVYRDALTFGNYGIVEISRYCVVVDMDSLHGL